MPQPQTALAATPRTTATADVIVAMLEEAGTTLLSLPESRLSHRALFAQLGGFAPSVGAVASAHAWSRGPTRGLMPTRERIARMDEAFGWLALIPEDRPELRRIVAARALVSPLTGRHLCSWCRLAEGLGTHLKAVQRQHAEGIAIIVRCLGGG